MDDQKSTLWNVALVLSLLLLAGVLYYRFAPVREMVDAKCPWIKEQLAKKGIQFDGATATISASSPDQPRSADPTQAMNLAQIAADRSLWPKSVKIKQTTEFPAVSNGKEVGKLSVPAGTEVKLISVTSEKVGVAYSPDGTMHSAGGTWLLETETDLFERVRPPR